MSQQKIAFGSDHGGYRLKSALKSYAEELGFSVIDQGTHSEASCDAADYAVKVAASVKSGEALLGVVICKTGQMTNMAANRIKTIRSALCTDTTMARMAREHNNANILSLGADIIGEQVAKDCLKTFLTTEFLGLDRYIKRNEKLDQLEI